MIETFRLSRIGQRVAMPAFVLVALAGAQTVFAEDIELKNLLIRLVDEVAVPARATGALSEIKVQEGSVVTANQVLAQIDDTEAILDLERSKIETEIALRESKDDTSVRSALKGRAFAVNEFQRLQDAKTRLNDAVSDSEIEKAQRDADQAQIEFEKSKSDLATAAVRLNLSRTKQAIAERAVDVRRIVAPQGGVVLEVTHQVGEWVTPGATIFRVVDTKRLRIEGYVSAEKLDAIQQGQSVVVTPVGSATQFQGKVTFLSPEVDLDGKARIVAELINEDGMLRPGIRADLVIQAGET